MPKKPTYEKLEQRVKELENEISETKLKENLIGIQGELSLALNDVAFASRNENGVICLEGKDRVAYLDIPCSRQNNDNFLALSMDMSRIGDLSGHDIGYSKRKTGISGILPVEYISDLSAGYLSHRDIININYLSCHIIFLSQVFLFGLQKPSRQRFRQIGYKLETYHCDAEISSYLQPFMGAPTQLRELGFHTWQS